MLYNELGHINQPSIMLLHGAGLNGWMFNALSKALSNKYHVYVMTLMGHGNNTDEFTTIHANASALNQWITQHCNGHIDLLYGCSLGGQLALQMIALQPDICSHLILESAALTTMKFPKLLMRMMIAPFYGLIKRKWFARLQFDALHIPKEYFDQYFHDSIRISKDSLINILHENMTFSIGNINSFKGSLLYLYGSRENHIVRLSANKIKSLFPNAHIESFEGLYHGQCSMIQFNRVATLIDHILQ